MSLNKSAEVFKTGYHTDASGKQRYWSTKELDTIADKYNQSTHEAPVVIGHPTNNAPAYGWVESLKREGNVLMATFKQLQSEFIDCVNKGLYKKRSISLYPDLTLKHIGFLGAVAPAIKGLKDVTFSNNQSNCELYEFSVEQNVLKSNEIKLSYEANDNSIFSQVQKYQDFSESKGSYISFTESLNLVTENISTNKAKVITEKAKTLVDRVEQKGKALNFTEALNVVTGKNKYNKELITLDAIDYIEYCERNNKPYNYTQAVLTVSGAKDINDKNLMVSAAETCCHFAEKQGKTITICDAISIITKETL
ncbi:MAG: hypothetical protein AB1782_13090 [Cyanobacteriota bacterium]